MEEDDNKSRLRIQAEALRSGNRPDILATLREIRTTGKVAILPELFDLLLDQEDEQIAGEIISLLNDLKNQEAAEVLAGAIGNPYYADLSTVLVAACWQNGLSYGRHLDTFVNVALNSDYETAIEAFTVIEVAVGDVPQEQRKKLVTSIKSRLPEMDAHKKSLLRELVRVIEAY
jgi:hypothetical protein